MVEPRNTRKSLSTLVRGLITFVVLIAVIGSLYTTIGQLERNPIAWEKVQYFWFLPAFFGSLAALHCAAWFWWQTLSFLHEPQRLASTFAAFFWSQLGKYVPGKAMVVVIRTAHSTAHGVPLAIAIASTFLETLLWLAVGSFIAAVGLWLFFSTRPDLFLLALAVAVVFGWATFPPVFDRLVRRLTPRRLSTATTSSETPPASKTISDAGGFRISWTAYGKGWLVLTLGWVLVGFSTWCIYRALPGHTVGLEMFGPLLTAIALATSIGFITLIPGGLGVRELVLLPLLAPQLGIDQAVAIAIIARLMSMAAEVASIGIWDFLSKRSTHLAAGERRQP